MHEYIQSEKERERRRKYMSLYRVANREKLAAVRGLAYQANSEKILAKNARWRAANPEKVAASYRKWRKSNPEKIAVLMARYRKANPVKVAERYNSYRKKNPDKEAAKKARWQKRYPHIVSAISARRRAAKLQATPTWADDFAMGEAYELAQLRSKATGVKHHVDHVVPLQNKAVCGLHCEFNLRVIPGKENLTKNNRHWPDMF